MSQQVSQYGGENILSRLPCRNDPLSLSSRTLVVAEIGVNHDGSVERALELVSYAQAAGADAVKLQVFQARQLIHPGAQLAEYQKRQCPDSDAAGMLLRYELSPEGVGRVVAAIRQQRMVPLATPFSLADLDTIAELDLPAIKIASPDLINYPLLERAASLRRLLLISTGAASMEEVARTVSWLEQWGASFALLHCVSSYPTPAELAHLCWIRELRERFGAARGLAAVGFSDHTEHELTGALAVAWGARIIEKHLTYDRKAPGPDHAASADPGQFARYVQAIRLAERLAGQPPKRVLAQEQELRRLSRQSLVLAHDVPANKPLTPSDLTIQRPGTGIVASAYPQVIGRSLKHAQPGGLMLQWEMLA